METVQENQLVKDQEESELKLEIHPAFQIPLKSSHILLPISYPTSRSNMNTIQGNQLVRYEENKRPQPKTKKTTRNRESHGVKKKPKKTRGRPLASGGAVREGRTYGGVRKRHIREKASNHKDISQGNQQKVKEYLFMQKNPSARKSASAKAMKVEIEDLGNMFGGLKFENNDIAMDGAQGGENATEQPESGLERVLDALQNWKTKLDDCDMDDR